MKVIFAYIPVLHEGYRRFFDTHPDAKELLILGDDVKSDYRPLQKDIRALPAETIRISLKSWNRFEVIEIVSRARLTSLAGHPRLFVMPHEDVMRDVAERFLKRKKIVWESIFLRWDKHRTMEEQAVGGDQVISKKQFDQKIIKALQQNAEKESSDFWRRIGAAAVKKGKIILSAHNHHLPSAHAPYVHGDPRNNFSKGVAVELSTAIHAEAAIVAHAAKKGVPLSGLDLYVSTFPCPPCAKLIAASGIKRLFYTGGYGMLDGVEILKSAGVEIIFVEMKK